MGVGGQHHAPAALPSWKTQYPLYRRLGGPQGRSGRVRKISLPLGFDPRTVQPVVSRYADWAIAAHNSYSTYIIYVCGRRRNDTPWRAAGCNSHLLCRPVRYRVAPTLVSVLIKFCNMYLHDKFSSLHYFVSMPCASTQGRKHLWAFSWAAYLPTYPLP